MKFDTVSLPGFNGNELIIREGRATKAYEPRPVKLTGTITTPFNWLQKKLPAIIVLVATIIFDKAAGFITLFVNERDPNFDEITGKIEFHPDFIKFGINSGEQHNPHELAEMIKMWRSCFKSKEVAMKLVKDLRSFKAKVDKDLEAFKDDRANYNLKKSQVVQTNIPESFILVVPVFKGQPKESIEVEINIDADKLTCSLISPAANDYIAEFKDKIIDKQIKKIQELCPELAIIEC